MFKRKSTLVFFICFLLSSLLWIFNTLSKKTNQSIIKEINIVNIPNNVILDSLSTGNIKINLEGYGSTMFKLFFSNKKITVNYNEIENGIISLNKEIIYNSIPNELKILDINPNQLKCFFSTQKTKKIPISTKNITINCKSPYKISGSIIIDPDSVIISGGETKINKIKEWNVKPLVFENVEDKIYTTIKLQESDFLSSNINEVSLQINVDEYTESEINVPIEIINKSEKNIKLSPKSLKIKYLIAIKNYNKISTNDFQIICDWKNINPNKREIKITDVTGPDYVEIINKKTILNKKISIWVNEN